MQGGTTQPTPRHRGGRGGTTTAHTRTTPHHREGGNNPQPHHTTPRGGGREATHNHTTPQGGGGTIGAGGRGGGGPAEPGSYIALILSPNMLICRLFQGGALLYLHSSNGSSKILGWRVQRFRRTPRTLNSYPVRPKA